jgi:starch synthase
VLLGSAPDSRVQNEFNQLRDALLKQYPDRACLQFAYDEPLSHLIYAGTGKLLSGVATVVVMLPPHRAVQ